ncbi:MAG: hypothetical protein H7066_00715 [Cytophagaceae bacterium]|nr:hypothetical protein [Gemmatimonadaceae bacterium]
MPEKTTPRGLEFIAGDRTQAWVSIGNSRYLVILEMVTCREDNTYVPPGAIGFARMFPLVWAMANEDLERIEIQFTAQRPRHAMTHDDPTMERDIIAKVFADVNQDHVPIWPDEKHLPYWQDFFEYYVLDPAKEFKGREPETFDHPLQRRGEVTMVDSRQVEARKIDDCVFRLVVGTQPDRRVIGSSLKRPRQGQFDNVHLAPRMRVPAARGLRPSEAARMVASIEAGSGSAVVRDNASDPSARDVFVTEIVMAPFCIHDCLHLHTRWSAGHQDKHLRGFDGFTPHATRGAPAVPANQSVFVSFPTPYTLRYRAVAEPAAAGEWQCFVHHGFGYVIDTWPAPVLSALGIPVSGKAALDGIKVVAALNAFNHDEPLPDLSDDGDGWSRVYWRMRFGGKDDVIAERLTFDLDKCLR